MKRSVTLLSLIGFVFTSVLGTLLHFLYDWTGNSPLVAPFSGVNESTWEHMKLLFWPLFIYALIESRFFKGNKNYWSVKLAGISVGLTTIPVLYYTYNGAFGKSPDWLNISFFFVSAAAVFLFEALLLKREDARYVIPSRTSLAIICVIGAMFVLFTFRTPEIPLFADPVSGLYGR